MLLSVHICVNPEKVIVILLQDIISQSKKQNCYNILAYSFIPFKKGIKTTLSLPAKNEDCHHDEPGLLGKSVQL